VLSGCTVVETPTLRVDDVRCSASSPGWSAPEPVTWRAVVLVRSGVFRRRVGSREVVLDPSSGYLPRPGTEQSFAHPAGGDRCTSIKIAPEELTALTGGGTVPPGDFISTVETQVAHRALAGRARAGADPDELAERGHVLVGTLVTGRLPVTEPFGSATARRAVDQVRELVAVDPSMSLTELAGATGLSAFHLSRVFRRATGRTISAYRIGLKITTALDQLADGETDLAQLAARVGFADQAHLTRLLRRESGWTPGLLRRMITIGT
jgi:AraC-like DNA-binding protein